MTELEHSTGSIWSPAETFTDAWQGGLKLQGCSCSVVDLNIPANRAPHEVQSPDDPSQRPDRLDCDHFSPSSPPQARLRELFRARSPQISSLERLREKIRQQRLDRKSVMTPNDSDFTPVSHRGRITRKTCRVKFDPSVRTPTLRGLTTPEVKSNNHHKDPPSGVIPPSMKNKDRIKDVARISAGCHSDTRAMKEAQPGLGLHQKVPFSSTMRTNLNRTGVKHISMEKLCKPVVRGRSQAPGVSKRNLQKTTQKPKPSNTTCKISSKRNLDLKSPISTSGTPSNSMAKKSLSPSTDKPIRMLDKSPIPSKVHSCRSPSQAVSTGRSLGWAPRLEEDKGPERSQGPQRCSAQEVRAFMGQKQRDRRRKERQKKEELQREEERRRACVQEVLNKQRMALNRAKVHPQIQPQMGQGVTVTGPGQNQEAFHCGRGKSMPRGVWQGKGTKVNQVSYMLDGGPGLRRGTLAAESRVQRVKALRDAAVVLGIRVEEETGRLWAAAGQTLNPPPGLTRPTLCPECQSKSCSFSKDLPWSKEPNADLEDIECMVSSATATRSHSQVEVQGSATITMRAGEPLRTSQDPQTSMEEPLTVADAVEQQLTPEEGRVTPLSKYSDSSDNTDSTSKWSELSEFFGHRELLSHLSLAMFQQSLREEELRARHHSALCRLREEALREKTRMEIAWLEHRRRCLRVGADGSLADITKKQAEVLNRMRQEQAEIRHWQNMYRSGRQQRKLLLWQQKEVVEIRKSAAQLKKQLQEQESALPGQTQAEARGSQSSQDAWSQETNSPKARLHHPAQAHLQSPWREGTEGASFLEGASPPGGQGLPSLGKCLENKVENEKLDASETPGDDLHLESEWKSPTIQQGWAFSKNSWDREVSNRKQLNRASMLRCDLLLEGDVFQDSHTAGQDSSVPATQPGIMVDVKARSVPSEEESLEMKALEDSQQLEGGTFSMNTDTGSRRFLTSEDGWYWRKQGSASDEIAPAEQSDLRAPQIAYPSSLAGLPKKDPLLPPKSFHAEERGLGKEEESLNQRETMTMAEAQSLQDYPTAFVSEGQPQALPPPTIEEEFSPPERVSQEEESWSDESSSSGGPLRVRSLPDFAEVSWKSQKSVGSFASLPEFQSVTAVCMNMSEMSGPSSDVEEDLPLDVEDCGWTPAGRSNEGDWEQSNEAAYKPHPAPVVEPQKGMGNRVALNIHNNQRSQSTLTSNNNCEIMPSPCATVAGDRPGMLLHAGTLPDLVNSGSSPGPGSPGPDAASRDSESLSADYSLSETEEESEVLSFSSECLISSGEEDPEQISLGIKALAEGQGPAHLTHSSGQGAPSSMCHEIAQTFPEIRQPIQEECTSQKESETNNPGCFASPWKPPTPEQTLSEILSPVDEVLSYGSIELPPTVTDDLMLPPPPACEVITWTSEEGFPPPPEELCEPHPLEDPSIKSDDLPSLSDDPLLPVATRLPTGLTDRDGNDRDLLKVNLVAPGFSLGQRSCEDQGKEDVKSAQLSALSTAEEDEDSNSSDPLSSFRIGERVLVCGSKPGNLRFKGVTSFASGYWAGVALDHSVGNHDGMFRGVRYFQCSKNCGVLVRAEDVSRLLSGPESDLETRADDPFSDEEPPGGPPDGWAESTGKRSGTGVEESWSQSQKGERSSRAGGHSSLPQMSRGGFSKEQNNNTLQSPAPLHEEHETTPERSSHRACGGFYPSANDHQWEEDIHWESHQLPQGMLEAEKKSCLTTVDVWNSMCSTGDLGECGGPNYLMVDRSPWNCLKESPEIGSDTAPFSLLEQSTNQTPVACLRSPLEKRDMAVQPAPCSDTQAELVGPGGRCINYLDTLVDHLMGELLMEVVKEAKVKMKYHGKKSTLTKENHAQKPQALGKGDGGHLKPSLHANLRPSPPCLGDQWRCSLVSVAQPRVRVEPHDPGVVYRLVEESVEALWAQTGGRVVDSTEAPAYLASEESRRAYRKVIFDLTSDIYQKSLRCHWGTRASPWELKETSSISHVWSGKTSLSNIKAVILAEVQRELNLERTNVQNREMMYNLCKYRTAHRDRVDYVLIQELHKEEQQWVDYSLDQLTVKMQLTEEIFDILLQDTISVLNQIYTVPSGDRPPVLQAPKSSVIP